MATLSYRGIFYVDYGGYPGEELGVGFFNGSWYQTFGPTYVVTPWVDAEPGNLIGRDFGAGRALWRDSPNASNGNSCQVLADFDYYVGNITVNADNSVRIQGDAQLTNIDRVQNPGISTGTCYQSDILVGSARDVWSAHFGPGNICQSGTVPGFSVQTYNFDFTLPPLSEASSTQGVIWIKSYLDNNPNNPLYGDYFYTGVQFKNNLEPRYIPGRANFDGGWKTLNNGIGVQANFNGGNQVLWNYFSGGTNQVVANFDGGNFERVNVE